jgi:hypothetical protein
MTVTEETIEVELQGGIKIPLPTAQAEAYRAARAKDKSEREDLAKRLGAIEADRKAAEDAKRAAEEKASLEKLSSKEEFQKALANREAEFGTKLGKIATRYRDAALKAAITAHPKVAALPDAEARAAFADLLSLQLSASCKYNIEGNVLEVVGDGGAALLDSEGKVKQADAWIAERLDASPLLRPVASPGSGGDGKTAGGATPAKVRVTNAQVQKGLTPELLKSGNYDIVG